jgi:hypothetical protein
MLIVPGLIVSTFLVLLFPIIYLGSAPFILIVSAFQKEPYFSSVATKFGNLTELWKEWRALTNP